jgi:hypothetical protein
MGSSVENHRMKARISKEYGHARARSRISNHYGIDVFAKALEHTGYPYDIPRDLRGPVLSLKALLSVSDLLTAIRTPVL